MNDEIEKVDIHVINKGAPTANFAWIHRKGDEIIAIGVDLSQKGCEIIATSGGDHEGPGVMISMQPPSGKCNIESLTWISFPKYKGWSVWSAQIGKCTLTVCIVKDRQ